MPNLFVPFAITAAVFLKFVQPSVRLKMMVLVQIWRGNQIAEFAGVLNNVKSMAPQKQMGNDFRHDVKY